MMRQILIPLILLFFAALGSASETACDEPVDCDIHHGPCTREVSNSSVSLDISPKPLKAMKDLIFRVTSQGQESSEDPYIDLSMPGMKMGPNRVNLRTVGKGRYEGQGVIIGCPSGRRIWKATVTLPGVGVAEYVFNVID